MLDVPRLPSEPLEHRSELVVRLADDHVPSPAAVPRLDDDRRMQRLERAPGTEVPCPGMREARAAKQAGGHELVVRRDQGGGAVQDRDATGRQDAEGPEAVVDAVEGLAHVEAAEHCVPGAERRGRYRRRHRDDLHIGRRSVAASASVVRLGAAETMASRMPPLNRLAAAATQGHSPLRHDTGTRRGRAGPAQEGARRALAPDVLDQQQSSPQPQPSSQQKSSSVIVVTSSSSSVGDGTTLARRTRSTPVGTTREARLPRSRTDPPGRNSRRRGCTDPGRLRRGASSQAGNVVTASRRESASRSSE